MINLRGVLAPVVVSGLAVGVALGIASFTFAYARGGSYMSDNPSACANCHVMEDHYSAWMKSSHRSVATCNDCHTSPGTVNKYLDKAGNGFRHSLAFTTGGFADPLRITAQNSRVTEKACRKCHEDITAAMDQASFRSPSAGATEDASCIRCHSNVGHWTH
jgi:cytochrome c nitrite reductase small subunit